MRSSPFFVHGILALFLSGMAARGQSDAPPFQLIVNPENSFGYAVRDGQNGTLINVNLIGWAPSWGWVTQPESKVKGTGDHLDLHSPFTFNAAKSEAIDVHLEASPTSKNAIAYKYTLTSDRDVPLTMMAAEVLADPAQKPQTLILTTGGGEVKEAFPLNRQDEVASVTKAVFQFKSGNVEITFDPPATAALQSMGFRLELAAKIFKTGNTSTTLTYTVAQPMAFLASEEAMAQFTQKVSDSTWFPWAAADHTSPSVFAMDNWLDKPAGKHGGVEIAGDHFQFKDGTSIKFWGTNIPYGQCAPEHDVAQDVATRFARYGINAVRLHKFTGPMGWEGFGDPNDFTQFDPKGLEKFDYFTSQLANRGIYYAFSHTFNMQIRPGNKSQIFDYDEIQSALGGKTMGLINFSEDLQDLLIKSVVNLLAHKNPYTGKTYAEDPALCYIEIQNEDDIFWYQTADTYTKCPTYAKRLREHYVDWLKQKYSNQDALAKAWTGALKDGETLDSGNIGLDMNPYNFTDSALAQQSAGGRQRSLDAARFLHETQENFYTKFTKAIRDAGYTGPLCGSPWQAPPMVPAYYNLLSDAEVGFVDRHNYFGDEDVFATMLKAPGSGYLSTGLQQVADHPFGLSEWITNFPLMYQADGPVIMAAYGLGLQGWDSSFEFNSAIFYDNGSWFAPNAGGLPLNRWYVDSPVQVGQFPALARMIYRNDVHEGDVISSRNTSLDEISRDQFSFSDKAEQEGDVKTFSGSCPPEALAAGRCVVAFTDTPKPSTEPDMSKYSSGSVITSTTGQLKWDTSDKGFFTIDTEGTKAVVGSAAEKPQTLGDVTITSHTPYASIILTALDQNSTLRTTQSALLMVVARAVNTNFTVNLINNHMLNPGTAPLLMEPVKVDIAITGRDISAVNILSQNGVLTNKTLPVQNGVFHVNSADDQTIYYQVKF
jgi:Beta-galactosidase